MIAQSCRVSPEGPHDSIHLQTVLPGGRKEKNLSTNPHLLLILVAISGLHIYGHQVGPLVACVSIAKGKSHTEDERQRCVAWHMRKSFASVVCCLERKNYPTLNELKQHPFHLLTVVCVSNLGWVQWRGSSAGLARGSLLSSAGLPGAYHSPQRPCSYVRQLLLADGSVSFAWSLILKEASLGFLT